MTFRSTLSSDFASLSVVSRLSGQVMNWPVTVKGYYKDGALFEICKVETPSPYKEKNVKCYSKLTPGDTDRSSASFMGYFPLFSYSLLPGPIAK